MGVFCCCPASLFRVFFFVFLAGLYVDHMGNSHTLCTQHSTSNAREVERVLSMGGTIVNGRVSRDASWLTQYPRVFLENIIIFICFFVFSFGLHVIASVVFGGFLYLGFFNVAAT